MRARAHFPVCARARCSLPAPHFCNTTRPTRRRRRRERESGRGEHAGRGRREGGATFWPLRRARARARPAVATFISCHRPLDRRGRWEALPPVPDPGVRRGRAGEARPGRCPLSTWGGERPKKTKVRALQTLFLFPARLRLFFLSHPPRPPLPDGHAALPLLRVLQPRCDLNVLDLALPAVAGRGGPPGGRARGAPRGGS